MREAGISTATKAAACGEGDEGKWGKNKKKCASHKRQNVYERETKNHLWLRDSWDIRVPSIYDEYAFNDIYLMNYN